MTAVFEEKNDTQSNDKSKDGKSQDNQTYGQEIDKEPPLDFLTGSTVLLKPGVFEFDLGFGYKQSRKGFKIGYWEHSSYEAKQLELSLEMRAGLWNGAEGHIRLPYTYTKIRDVSTNEWVQGTSSWDFGDLSFGLQQTLIKESANWPAVTASLSVNAPTGEKHYRSFDDAWKDPLDNSSGHWGLTPGLSFVRTVDPAIVFGGVNYQYSFKQKIDGYNIEPGWGLMGYLGLGFALNEKLSIGLRTSLGHHSDMAVDGTRMKGSSTDPFDLALTASYRAWDDWVVTPEVRFGLNDDAGQPFFGLRFTRRF